MSRDTFSIGRQGSDVARRRLTLLHVLYRADAPLVKAVLRERGWPQVRFDDDWGALHSDDPEHDTKLAVRTAYRSLDELISVALTWLKRASLVASEPTSPGARAHRWTLTPAARAWLEAEALEFAASVAGDLAALPTTEGAP